MRTSIARRRARLRDQCSWAVGRTMISLISLISACAGWVTMKAMEREMFSARSQESIA
jgi:hypothetical protein